MSPTPPPDYRVTPIGYYRGGSTYRYTVPPQPGLTNETQAGVIEFEPQQNFETALADLEGFSHIWVLFWFDQVRDWKPKVKPPRRQNRCGVFATRSPHRPNPIGMSCLKLHAIEGRRLHILDADLVDGTPVLDVKPYLPYADSHPEATLGWVPAEFPSYTVTWQTPALEQRNWLHAAGVPIEEWAHTTLTLFPQPRRGHRVRDLEINDGIASAEFACRTWRLDLVRNESERSVVVTRIRSGHPSNEIAGAPSRWNDLELHRRFLSEWPQN